MQESIGPTMDCTACPVYIPIENHRAMAVFRMIKPARIPPRTRELEIEMDGPIASAVQRGREFQGLE